MKLPSFSLPTALLILRLYMGITFMLHGMARLYYMSIDDFGAFLNSRGFMIGVAIAWTITIAEAIGGFLLMIGYKIQYVLIFNFLVILGGIVLVHFKNGFFVVGHGQGGVEYSLLILSVIIVLYSTANSGLSTKQPDKYKIKAPKKHEDLIMLKRKNTQAL